MTWKINLIKFTKIFEKKSEQDRTKVLKKLDKNFNEYSKKSKVSKTCHANILTRNRSSKILKINIKELMMEKGLLL